jgi:hypothetical protein
VYIIGTIVIDEPERAEACFRESLATASTTKYSLTVGNSKRQLARLAARAGRDEEAAGLFADAIAHFARTEDHSQTWDALRSTSLLLAARDRGDLAARVLASSHRDPPGAPARCRRSRPPRSTAWRTSSTPRCAPPCRRGSVSSCSS